MFKRRQDNDETPLMRRRVIDKEQARPQAFSYYSSRSTSAGVSGRRSQVDENGEQQLSVKAETAAFQNHKALLLTLAVVAVAFGIYSLGLTTNPKVVPLMASDSSYFLHSAGEYEATAAHKLSQSVLNRNKLTIDTDELSNTLTKQYPEIHTATVELPVFSRRPVIYIEPHTPSMILATADSKAFLIDEQGRALVAANRISDAGELMVPTVYDQSGLGVTVGKQALPEDVVGFIDELTAILKAADISYGSIELPPSSSELRVHIAKKPYYVKFNLRDDARLQAGTFIATRLRLEKDGITPGEYIDVRVAGRAYYK